MEGSTRFVIDIFLGLIEETRGVDSAGTVAFDDILLDFRSGTVGDEKLDFLALKTTGLPTPRPSIGLFPCGSLEGDNTFFGSTVFSTGDLFGVPAFGSVLRAAVTPGRADFDCAGEGFAGVVTAFVVDNLGDDFAFPSSGVVFTFL